MSHWERTWGMVLAGGAIVTSDSQSGYIDSGAGQHQFGELLGRQSLLKMTLSRAGLIVPNERICVIIDHAQKHYWNDSLARVTRENVIVQPSHRGSAIEILLGVLRILALDPSARILVLPSRYYVGDERALASSLVDVATPTAQTRNKLTLVGIRPEEADPELGYILPGQWFEDGTRSVHRVLNCSGQAQARELVAHGALWNSSILAARGVVLLSILRSRMPELVDQMETAIARGDGPKGRANELAQLYARLPSVDFSQVLAQGAETECRLITSRPCGWSDLGTLRRVAAVARRIQFAKRHRNVPESLRRVTAPKIQSTRSTNTSLLSLE
jgi:mannose-1-phosphate guanylyltransferase